MRIGDVVVYKCDEEVRVGVMLGDDETVVYGESLDSLAGAEIIKVYEGVPELVSAYENIERSLKTEV